MANGFPPVQPGDLITSGAFNQVLLKLNELDQRVQSLEGGSSQPGSGVVIAAFVPATQVAVGQELRILGSGFLFPPHLNTATVDGVPVEEFRAGSTSAELRFLVPQLATPVPDGGRNVTVRVTNANGSAERLYRILPAVPVTGDPPQIDTVTHSNGSTTLRVGQEAVISGSGFGATAPENQIRFIVDLGGGATHVYPEPGAPLVVNSTAADEIRLVVPNIDEAPTVGSLALTLEITVGAHPPATSVVRVRA